MPVVLDLQPFKDEPLDADKQSDAIAVGDLDAFSAAVEWVDGTGADGNPSGNIVLAASHDKSNWFDVQTQAVANNAGEAFFEQANLAYKWARFEWRRTTGIATDLLTITMQGARRI